MSVHLLEIKRKVDSLPRAPGVYLFKGERGEILYIGKAKDLRARVQTYLHDHGDDRALIPYLRAEARDLDFLVTPSEFEALLLESSLIRKEKPRYNIRLKDDKSFVSVRYDPRQDFSRLETVRRIKRDGARYLGPFPSAGAVRDTLRLILPLHPLRLCTDHVFRNRSRPCVYYQIGRCPAPCVGRITPEAYRENLDGAVRLLRGRRGDLIRTLEERMWAASDAHNFEVAARLRDRIQSVRRTVEHARVITTGQLDRDVFALARQGDRLVVEVLSVRDGCLLSARSHAFLNLQDDEEALTSFLVQYYGTDRGVPAQVLVEALPEARDDLEAWFRTRHGRAVRILAPVRGDGRKLLDMAARNAAVALEQEKGRSDRTTRVLADLRSRLELGRDPVRMEGYDISHTRGGETVGVAVTFEQGEPARSLYRKYRIRRAVDGDDYAALEEVLRRRFTRLLTEDAPWPDLVLIDGGVGQLRRAEAVLTEVGIDPADLDLVALAKGRTEDGKRVSPRERQEKVHVARTGRTVVLSARSPALRLLDQLRDEAHRFAITYHRKLRARARVGSALDEVPGVGPRLRRRILEVFGSVDALQGKSAEEIADRARVPFRVARRVQERFGGGEA